MSALIDRARAVIARIKLAAAHSTWPPLAGRGAGYLLGFALLALVGSGRMARWISPAVPRLGISVAEAATAPPPPVAKAVRESASAAAVSAEAVSTVAPSTEVAEGASAKTDAGAPLADPGTHAPSKAMAADGKVILNLAAEEDLRRLPGIGRTRAQAILALRTRMKKFTQIEDLLKVKGIGRRFLARLRPMIRVD
jgi:competence protein ComEA